MRDRHCRFGHCSRPALMCHAHHIKHWVDGGDTSLGNMLLLCGHHHRLVHSGPWQIITTSARQFEFVAPGAHTRRATAGPPRGHRHASDVGGATAGRTVPVPDLANVESRLRAIVDRYRPELVDGTIYGVPSLVWPGAGGHDYFVALKSGKTAVGLYLIIADRYPDDLAAASPDVQARRTGRATFSFSALEDQLATDLAAFLDRLLVRYRAEHAA